MDDKANQKHDPEEVKAAAELTKPKKEKLVKDYRLQNKRLERLKGLKAIHSIIALGKIQGKSDKQIAEEVGCCEKTIQRERHKLQNSEYIKQAFCDLWDLLPLMNSGLKYNAMVGNPFTIVKFYEGMGIWNKHQEINVKITKEAQQKKFVENMKNAFGTGWDKPVNRLKDKLPEGDVS